jgi:hypothetical protein
VKRLLLRPGIGAICGVISGLLAFCTVSAAYFSVGLYSRSVLIDGAVLGAASGLVFGAIFGAVRTPLWKAILWQTGVLGGVMLGFGIWLISMGTVYSSAESAIYTTLLSVSLICISSALAAAASIYSIKRMTDYLEATFSSPQRTARRPTGSDRPYHL